MKKHFLFVALAAFFSFNLFAQDEPLPSAPDLAPAVPDKDVANVLALYCNHYTENNLHFIVQGWGGIETWQELDIEGTKVMSCQDMKWEILTNEAQPSYDVSEYDKLHFDVWVPQASRITLTVESKVGKKGGVAFSLNAGWNTIDAERAWWPIDAGEYDWKDLEYIIFEQFQTLDEEPQSLENTPFAFTNIYFWKTPAPQNIPSEAPADPTMAEDHVMALFSSAYPNRTFNFAPTSWGSQWLDVSYSGGQHIWYCDAFAWDGFTNWDADHYDLTEYDMMHADVYVTVDSRLTFTFEALSAGDGGSGWKNGASVELKANEWNAIDLDLLNAPYDSYDFTDLRYLILEGFGKAEGGSAEGTPLAIANVYFWNSMNQGVENIDADKVATKHIVNGQLVIEKNGKRYNAIGTQF